MPKPGDVYIYHQFKFSDGSLGEKLFIVLNKPAPNVQCLILITTSKSERYVGVTQGCNPGKKVFYIPKEWQKFDLNTYVQLQKIYSIIPQHIIQFSLDKKIEHLFSLTEDCFRQLINCLKKHFKDDISQEHQDIIFA